MTDLLALYVSFQELLQLFGIPFVISPMEAEAQCAILNSNNLCDGSITEDSDIILFGAKKVYKNIFNQKRYAELYQEEDVKCVLGKRICYNSCSYISSSLFRFLPVTNAYN